MKNLVKILTLSGLAVYTSQAMSAESYIQSTIHEERRIVITTPTAPSNTIDQNTNGQNYNYGTSNTRWSLDTEEEHEGHSHEIEGVGSLADFQRWLNQNSNNRQSVINYENFLRQNLGAGNVPPMNQLLTTARSWQKCGYDPYQVPPEHLWAYMIPTIRLYNDLKRANILPPQTQIRSVYRSPELNRCAGGAKNSKHMTNGAMDIWVPDYPVGSWQLSNLQEKLCQFWLTQGERYQFGLGLYATGAIHLDTLGHRKWGAQFSQEGSACRLLNQ